MNTERKWSPQQEAVFAMLRKPPSETGNLLVRARAGTGKTTTIMEGARRCWEASRRRGVLMCAFGRHIAKELRQRLAHEKIGGVEAATLHGCGFRILTRYWKGAHVPDDKMLRGLRSTRLSRAVLGRAPDDIVRLTAKLADHLKEMFPIGTTKEQSIGVAYAFDLLPDEKWEEEWDIGTVASAALQVMDLCSQRPDDNYIDFSDQVFVPLRNGWVRGHYPMVIVDEAQDLNASQLLMAQRLCREDGRVIVVGDDRQAIYAFRGADPRAIENLKAALNATEIGLTVTYRCPKRVVEIAREIVPDFTASDDAPDGVVRTVSIDDMCEKPGEANPGNFILSRKNAPLAALVLRLLRNDKRAKIRGVDTGQNLVRVVRSIKAKTMLSFAKKLAEWLKHEKERVMASGRSDDAKDAKIAALEDSYETLLALTDGLATPKDVENRIAKLFDDSDGAGHAILSTIHKAKGLESDRVYILADTLYPRGRRTTEERNLEYVAVTRAKRELVWVK